MQNGEYLLLESLTSSETQCTFVKKPEENMKLCLTPVLTERPQILSYAPVLTSSMSLKDSSIQVMFDHDMDEASIYYTQEELTKLMSTLGITDPNDAALKTITIDGQKKYYGYVQDDQTFFKNISITNNTTGENLNYCFTAPVFETPKLLSIKPDENQLPPDYQQILVSLGKNFFYIQEQKQITMSGSKKWIYQVSNARDTTGPEIITGDPKIKLLTGNSFEELPVILNNKLGENWNNLKFAEGDTQTLYVDIMVKDEGCGVAPEFELILHNHETDTDIVKTVIFQKVSIWDASYKGQVDVSGLSEARYAVSMKFFDRRGNPYIYPEPESNKAYYFGKDETPPDVKYFIKSDGNTFTAQIESGHDDLKKMLITRTLNADPIILGNTCSQYYQQLSTVGAFSVKYLEDFAGHRVEVNSPSINIFRFNLSKDNYIYVYGKGIVKDLCVSPKETTQGEFERYFVYDNNSDRPTDQYGKGDQYPVYDVSLYKVKQYCNKLSEVNGFEPCYYELQDDGTKKYDFTQWKGVLTKYDSVLGKEGWGCSVLDNSGIKCDNTKNGYRLPTAEEWLYIANEANSTDYAYSGSNTLSDVAWYNGNSGNITHEVGKKTPNSLGIYDMSGNVAELLDDGDYAGGDSYDSSGQCLINKIYPNNHAYYPLFYVGFRMVRNAQAPAQ